MTASTDRCPNQESLYVFVQGELDDVTAESIATHVEGCTSCSVLVARANALQNTAATLAKFPRQEKDDIQVRRCIEKMAQADVHSADTQ